MKKIISIFIIAVLIISSLLINVSASEESFTKEQAIELVQRAYDNVMFTQYRIIYYYFAPEEKFVLGEAHPEESHLEIYYGEPGTNDSFLYYSELKPVLLENGNTLSTVDDIKKWIRVNFVDELVERVMSKKTRLGDKCVPSFRMSDEGKLLFNTRVGVALLFPPCELTAFKSFRVDGNNAIMNVTLGEASLTPPDFAPTLSNETVEFTKTADGWRVSGGTAFEVMLGDREPNSNPNTGDTSSVIVPTLTVAALISVALPVGIMRKRRRSA